MKIQSLVITVYYHSASLDMLNGDSRDRLFYPTLTLMIDSFSPPLVANVFLFCNERDS